MPMLRLLRLGSSLALLLWIEAGARAEQLPPPPPSPPPYAYPPPPYAYPPPPRYYLVPAPSPEAIDALEQTGKHERFAGVVLMASGGTIALVGTALLIAGVATEPDRCHDDPHEHQVDCTNAIAAAGVGTLLVGAAALGAGIPVYVIGNSRVARARALRRQLTVAPALHATRHGTGAVGGVSVAF